MVSRSYRIGVDSGLSWAYSALALAFASSWVVVPVAAKDQIGPWLWSAIGAFVVLSVCSAWRGARLRLGDRDVVAMAVIAVAMQVAWAGGSDAPIAPGQRCMVTTAVVFGAFAFASRRTLISAIAAAVTAQVVVDWVVVGPLEASENLWPVAAAGIAAAVCISVMREAARRADEASELQQIVSVSTARDVAQLQAQRDIQGVLHDDVVAALRAVSLPEVSWAEARRAADDAIAAIERAPASNDDHAAVDLSELVREVAPVPQTVTTIRVGDGVRVPGDVARAAVAAAAEVLRNVARHAHARHVLLTLERNGDGFALTIDDDGVGFRPLAAMNRSHGLRYSVVRRLEDVGGRADIDSAPGRGTTVRLAWESTSTTAPVQPTRAERIAAGIGDLRRPLVALCLPYLAMSGAFAVRYTVDGRLPWWLLAWFVGLCAITLIVATRVRTGLSGPVVAAALGYGVVGTVAALFLVPAGALHNYSSWPLGATASLLAIVVVVRPPWEAGTALLAQQVAIWVAAVSGQFDPGPSANHIAGVIPAALSTITPVVLGLVLGQAVLRLGGVVTRANNDIRARAAAESARLARESVHRRRRDDLNEEILPFLRGVAGPTSSRGRPGLRERARMLEHTARDELHLPGVLDIVARNLLRRARAGGCAVTLQAGGGDVAPPSLLRDVLVAALSSGAVPRELVVSINRTEDASSVSLVALPGDQDRAEALQREFGDAMSILDSTPEATWAEVRLPAPVIA